jgi:hypothetical protein
MKAASAVSVAQTADAPLPASTDVKVTPVDPSLPDDSWGQASAAAYETAVKNHYGSPETMAYGAEQHLQQGDFGTAVYLYCKSIDMLHTAYGFAGMERRRPSDADGPIIDGFCNALTASFGAHPEAGLDGPVREATHRLRSIASTCDGAGLSSGLYRMGLENLADIAPRVRVDDIFWH